MVAGIFATSGIGTVSGGGSSSFTAPDGNDWVLRIGGSPPDETAPTAPSGLSASSVSESEISISWTAANDPESGINSYKIYRNGAFLATVSGLGFNDTGLNEATTYNYQVLAINGASLEGPKSNEASATTAADAVAPTIKSAGASGDPNKVTVVFSEPVDQASAETV